MQLVSLACMTDTCKHMVHTNGQHDTGCAPWEVDTKQVHRHGRPLTERCSESGPANVEDNLSSTEPVQKPAAIGKWLCNSPT